MRRSLVVATWVNYIIGILVFAIACWQRIPTITFGLPYIPYPDESFVIDLVFRGFREDNLLFTNFLRPHLSYNLYAGAIAFDAWWHGYDVHTLPINTDRISSVITPFIATRSVSAIIGAGCCVALYIWGRQIFTLPYAILASITLAFVAYHIEFSGLLAPDIMACLGVTLFFMGASIYEKTPTQRTATVLAIATGITTGAKYNFIALIFPLAWMIWHRPYTPFSWRVVVRLLICTVVGFVVTTPSLVIHVRGFFEGFTRILSYYENTNAVAANYTSRFPIALYADWFSRVLISPYIAVCALLSSLIFIRRMPYHLQAAILFTGVQFCFFFAQGVHYPRNFLFYQPIVIMLALFGIVQSSTYIPQITHRKKQILGLAVSLILITPTLIAGHNIRNYFTRTYTPLQIDALIKKLPKNAPTIGAIEPTILADMPWIIPANLSMDQDIAYWQSSGVQTFIINRKSWPNSAINHIRAQTHINGDREGGSGWAYDIYTNDIRATLRTIGRPMRGADGVDIIGVRLGRGRMRNVFSPLDIQSQLRTQGPALQLNMYFHVQALPTQTSALLFVQLFDANGTKISERNTPPLAYYPMDQWQVGEIIVANADLPTDTLAPGTYQLVCGFYVAENDQRIALAGSNNGTYTIPITIVAP